MDDAETERLLIEKFGYRIDREAHEAPLRDGVRFVLWHGRGLHSRGRCLRSADGRLVFVRSVDDVRPHVAPIRDRAALFDYVWLLLRLNAPVPLDAGLAYSSGLTYEESLSGSGGYSEDDAKRWEIRVGFDVNLSGDRDEWILVRPHVVYRVTGTEREPAGLVFRSLPCAGEPEIALVEQRVRSDGGITGKTFRLLERGTHVGRYWRRLPY